MRAGGSKQKGAGFERLVCKHLSLWISGGRKEDIFWRSAMSGGRATLLKRKGKAAQNSAGDITATGEEGHALTDLFFIECKSYRSLDVDNFVLKSSGTLWKFWVTVAMESDKHGKAPLLIVKQNGIRPFLLGKVTDLAKVSKNFSNTWRPLLLPAQPFCAIPALGLLMYWFDELFPLPRTKPKMKRKE